MDELTWHEIPQLERPALLVALGGWSDAAEVGTWSVGWLHRAYKAQPLATIAGEGFVLLSQRRPLVHTGPDGQRVITWPDYRFSYCKAPGGRDLVLLSGPEPQLRWKTFTDGVLEVAQTLGIALMVSLGGLGALALHSDPPRVTGSANTPELTARLGAGATVSRYEGPVGLLSVLVIACRDAGMATASLWGQSPHYVQASPNLTVGVALLERLARLLDVSFDLKEPRARAVRFASEVSAAIAQDPEAARYVRQLEDQLRRRVAPPAGAEEDLPSSEHLIADLEEFLRRPRDEGQD